MKALDIKLHKHIDLLIKRYPVLKKIEEHIVEAYLTMEESYENGGKLLIAGNGGSAADAEHIVGELMKGFKMNRNPNNDFIDKMIAIDKERGQVLGKKLQGALPAMALNNHPSLNSAFLNDVDGTLCYAQQIYGYGKLGDIFLGISTSGNAKNVLYACVVAKAKGMKVIGFTGSDGGELVNLVDVVVKVDGNEAYVVQELHLPIYHCWCLMLEDKFYKS